MVPTEELAPLLAYRRPNGLWPAVWDGDIDVDFWASAIALNTLMILGAASEMLVGALDSLLHYKPLEASWLVRLKFRIADRVWSKNSICLNPIMLRAERTI
jgi:hypothetical protein